MYSRSDCLKLNGAGRGSSSVFSNVRYDTCNCTNDYNKLQVEAASALCPERRPAHGKVVPTQHASESKTLHCFQCPELLPPTSLRYARSVPHTRSGFESRHEWNLYDIMSSCHIQDPRDVLFCHTVSALNSDITDSFTFTHLARTNASKIRNSAFEAPVALFRPLLHRLSLRSSLLACPGVHISLELRLHRWASIWVHC